MKTKTDSRAMLAAVCVLALVLSCIMLAMSLFPGGFAGIAGRVKNNVEYILQSRGLLPPEEIAPLPEPALPEELPEPAPAVQESVPEDPLAELRARQEPEKWLLVLVNRYNLIPDSWSTELTEVRGEPCSVICSEALSRMLDDCEAAGNEPVICSGYRDREYQTELYYNKIERLIYSGVSEADAPAQAAEVVAVPGTSEHELGLSFDISDSEYSTLDSGQESTLTQIWLMENSWRYGFILRYPNGTTDITGIIYEPWHYRYVGNIAAQEIHERGITLEEYVQLLYG